MSWLTGSGIGYPYWLGQNPQPPPYGSFSSTQSQTVLGANVTTPISYDTTEAASQTYYSGSRIYVQASGVYKFTYTIQTDTTSGGSQNINVWIRKNGVNVDRSNSRFSIANNAENLAVCDYIIQSMLAGDYLEVVIQSTDAGMTAAAIPAGGTAPNNYPLAPSIISNIFKIA